MHRLNSCCIAAKKNQSHCTVCATMFSRNRSFSFVKFIFKLYIPDNVICVMGV